MNNNSHTFRFVKWYYRDKKTMLIPKFVVKCKLKVHSPTPKRELGMGTPR